ncbi:MAG: FAD-dependent monooxygenase [Pseudomonadota bacterium]
MDVIVAGGGIVGTLLGVALAQSGLRVTVCDALPEATRRAADFDGRAYAVAAAGQRMLATLGLWNSLAPHAQAMTDIRVSDGRPGEDPAPPLLHFDHRETDGGPFAFMLEDRHLRAVLQDAAMATPGLTLRAPVRITHHRAENGAVLVTLADGGRLGARLLAACDGRRSAVAARAGLHRTGWDYRQNGLVCALETEAPHEGVAQEIFLPAGPFALLPLIGKRVSLVWTESRAEAEAINGLSDGAYLAELRRRMGERLGAVRLVGRRYTYPLALSLAPSWIASRLALVGDSAHAIHPLAGQGLNLGFKDVAALAEVVATARRRGEDIGRADVLRRYQQWRRFDTAAMALACDGFNRLFSNDRRALRGLRRMGLALVDRLPAAKRGFIALAAGQTGVQPRLLRGLPI